MLARKAFTSSRFLKHFTTFRVKNIAWGAAKRTFKDVDSPIENQQIVEATISLKEGKTTNFGDLELSRDFQAIEQKEEVNKSEQQIRKTGDPVLDEVQDKIDECGTKRSTELINYLLAKKNESSLTPKQKLGVTVKLGDFLVLLGKLDEALEQYTSVDDQQPIVDLKIINVLIQRNELAKAEGMVLDTINDLERAYKKEQQSTIIKPIEKSEEKQEEAELGSQKFLEPTNRELLAIAYESYGKIVYSKAMVERYAHVARDMAHKAIQQYDNALQFQDTPKAITLVAKGLCFMSLNEEETAVEILLKAKQADPNYYILYFYLANAYQRLDKVDEALSCDTYLLGNYPKFVKQMRAEGHELDYESLFITLHLRRVDHYIIRDDCDMAMTTIDALFDSGHKLSPSQRALMHSRKGLCFGKKGDFWKCVRECNKAIDLDENTHSAYRERGYAYEALGKMEEAKLDKKMAEYLERVAALAPSKQQ